MGVWWACRCAGAMRKSTGREEGEGGGRGSGGSEGREGVRLEGEGPVLMAAASLEGAGGEVMEDREGAYAGAASETACSSEHFVTSAPPPPFLTSPSPSPFSSPPCGRRVPPLWRQAHWMRCAAPLLLAPSSRSRCLALPCPPPTSHTSTSSSLREEGGGGCLPSLGAAEDGLARGGEAFFWRGEEGLRCRLAMCFK